MDMINAYLIINKLSEKEGLSLTISLNLVSEDQSAIYAVKIVIKRENSFSAVKKTPVTENLYKVCNCQYSIDQCIKHLTLTDIFKMKHAFTVLCDVE
jgi:glycerol-3-phosphate dehydrogenase